MSHFDIFAKFLSMFPAYQETVRAWMRRGANSIAVETVGHQWLTFTFYNDREWELVATNSRVRKV